MLNTAFGHSKFIMYLSVHDSNLAEKEAAMRRIRSRDPNAPRITVALVIVNPANIHGERGLSPVNWMLYFLIPLDRFGLETISNGNPHGSLVEPSFRLPRV